jgi:uncharacterized membrane protein YedE/YeeE
MTKTLLAVFPDIDPAAHAVDKLHELGISDDRMSVISGIPVTEAMLGRPRQHSNVPTFALVGAILGFGIGIVLAFFTPTAYAVRVGGQPLIPGPPTVVVLFEMTMLVMLVSTFLGVFLDSYYPTYTPLEYVPEISDGRIAIIFECPVDQEPEFEKAMTALGAEQVKPAEAQHL